MAPLPRGSRVALLCLALLGVASAFTRASSPIDVSGEHGRPLVSPPKDLTDKGAESPAPEAPHTEAKSSNDGWVYSIIAGLVLCLVSGGVLWNTEARKSRFDLLLSRCRQGVREVKIDKIEPR
jgi:hypothetical protein